MTIGKFVTFVKVSTAFFATSSNVVPIDVLWFMDAEVSTTKTNITIFEGHSYTSIYGFKSNGTSFVYENDHKLFSHPLWRPYSSCFGAQLKRLHDVAIPRDLGYTIILYGSFYK